MPPKVQLSVYVPPPVLTSPSSSRYSSPPLLHLDMDLHISLPPTSFHLLQYIVDISHSQTVHGNELSASVGHSQRRWRRAASLSLSASAFVFLSVRWQEGCLSFSSFHFSAVGDFIMQISKEAHIHKYKLVDIHVAAFAFQVLFKITSNPPTP